MGTAHSLKHLDWHRKIVDLVNHVGIDIRVEARSLGYLDSEGMYITRLDPDDVRRRRIGVNRSTGGAWAAPSGHPHNTPQERAHFFDSVEEPLKEAIIIAHEFGHDQVRALWTDDEKDAYDSRYNSAKARLKNSESTSVDEAEMLYREEVDAWHHARTALQSIGFDDWASFDESRLQALESYEDGIRSVHPGWLPLE